MSATLYPEHRFLHLSLAVATAANEADRLEEAFQAAVDQVCTVMDWPVGHVYLATDAGELVACDVWHLADPVRYSAFRAAVTEASLSAGSGLPGRALASRRPVWVADVTKEPGFAQKAQAEAAGLRMGVAFPVPAGHRVAAVMEFFAPSPQPPDADVLQVMERIAAQLGRVVERERTVRALQASEERFRTLIEEVQDYAIFGLDPEGRIVSWNKGGERIKGYTDAEIIGRHVSVFYPPEDVAAGRPERQLAAAAREGRAEDEGWRVRKDGSRFWANAVVTAIFDERRALQGFSKVTRDLTESRKAETALQDRERQLRRAQEIAHFGSWEWNATTGRLNWSDELYRIYGLAPGEGISYERYLAAVHEDDREVVRRHIDEALRTRRSFAFRERIVRPDGTVRVLDSTCEVVDDPDGSTRLYGVCHDVTEVVEAEEQFRHLLESAPDAMIILRDSRIELVNMQAEAMFGYSREELLGHTIDILLPEQHPDLGLHAQLQPGKPRDGIEVVCRRKDGTEFPGEVRLSALETRNGSLFLAAIRDVARRKLAEQALAESEQRFRLLAENMTDLVTLHEADGSFAYVSPSSRRILGYFPEEMLGYDLFRFVHQDDVARLRQVWPPRPPTESAEVMFRMRTREGQYVWLDTTTKPILGPNGEVERILNSSRDVTERVRAEQAEARYRTVLEARNRELQDFAYVASHDLQEPLRKIRAFSNLLKESYAEQLDPTAQHYLDRIDDAATRMSNLISDLLSFSRITTKGNPFGMVDLGRVVEGVLSDLDDTVRELGARVELDPLPEIEADSYQMRQLLHQLIANALKFHRPGVPPLVRITATTERRHGVVHSSQGDLCRIEVTDNGIGFEEKYLDRIFTPFQRLHSREVYHGTGMGLAICRRIVERHGGTITARSTPGRGSTFTVVLPVRQDLVNVQENG